MAGFNVDLGHAHLTTRDSANTSHELMFRREGRGDQTERSVRVRDLPAPGTEPDLRAALFHPPAWGL